MTPQDQESVSQYVSMENPYPETPGNALRGHFEMPQMTQADIDQYFDDLTMEMGMAGMGQMKKVGKISDAVVSMLTPESQALRNRIQKVNKLEKINEPQGKVLDAMPRLIEEAAPNPKQVKLSDDSPWYDKFLARFGDDPKGAAALEKASLGKNPYENTSLLDGMPTTPNKNFKITKPGQVIGHKGIMEPFNNNFTEPFPWMDDKYGVSKSALSEAKSKNIPIEINTSSDLIGKSDYIEVIPNGSTINIYNMPNNEELTRYLFPGNPSRLRLEKAAKSLKQRGIKVNLIEPTKDDLIKAFNNKTNKKGLKFGMEDSELIQMINEYDPNVIKLK